MVFTVISIAPNLPPADYARAVGRGPPYIETMLPYPATLRQAGWEITKHTDPSAEYRDSVRRLLREEETHADELRTLLGGTEYSERLARRHRTLGAIDAGLLQREMFSAA